MYWYCQKSLVVVMLVTGTGLSSRGCSDVVLIFVSAVIVLLFVYVGTLLLVFIYCGYVYAFVLFLCFISSESAAGVPTRGGNMVFLATSRPSGTCLTHICNTV